MDGTKLIRGQLTAQIMHKELLDYQKRKEPLTLIEVLTIIKTAIPVYPSLNHETKSIMLELISGSYIFMAQLVSFTNAIPEKQAERRIYQQVMIDTLRHRNECLHNYMTSTMEIRIQRNNVKALVFGSKLFNVLSPEMDILDFLECFVEQWKYLLDREGSGESMGSVFGEFLVATLTLHPSLAEEVMFNRLFFARESYFKSMIQILRNASSLDQQRLIRNFLLPYLDLHLNESNAASIVNVLRQLPLDDNVDLAYILTIKSLNLQGYILRLLSVSFQNIVAQLLQRFGQPEEDQDERICQFFVIVLRYNGDHSSKSALGSDTRFLDGVTNRLMNKDHLVRERAMYIAKLVTNGELKYQSDFSIQVPEFELPQDNLEIDFDSIRHQQSSLSSGSTVIPQTELKHLSLSGDSDDEDEGYGETVKDIVFLKDLVAQFARIDSNKGTRVLPLLKQTVKLVRQKKDFPIEVSYHSSDLLVSISTLNNNLDEEDFENWRVNALVSILATTPESVTDELKILFTSEMSIQQRMSILSSLGLSARELRGYDDKSVVKPQFDFPTNRLPWDRKQTENPPQLTYVEEIPTEHIVWKSKKLQPTGKVTLAKNRFRKYSRLFFYPLAHGWLDGIDLGTFTELFKTHYLMTLRIIYQCANPVHDYDMMTQFMEQIMVEASQQGIKI